MGFWSFQLSLPGLFLAPKLEQIGVFYNVYTKKLCLNLNKLKNGKLITQRTARSSKIMPFDAKSRLVTLSDGTSRTG